MTARTFSFEDKLIYYALLGSCLIHAIFLTASYFIIPRSAKAKMKTVEIVYRSRSKPRPVVRPEQVQSVETLKEDRRSPFEPDPRKVEKQLLGTSVLRDAVRPSPKVGVAEKTPVRIPELVEKRSITVPVLNAQKINNPQYVTYNDRLRNKIRNRAYFYIDDPDFQAGEVYMTFVLNSDGTLKDLKVLDERSRANQYLRDVGFRSIKESSPFPPFPAELRYPELSFNVVISFEIDKE